MGSPACRFGVLLFAPIVLAQSPLGTAPDAAVIEVSPHGGRFSEPGLAVNPNNPNQIVVVFQGGAETQGSATAAYSTDGGKTFQIAEGTKPSDWRVAGDVTSAFDNQGHAFLCYLAFDRLGTTSYWAHKAGRNGIFVRRSLDGGKSWEANAAAVKAFPTGHESNLAFEDEPRIFADTDPRSPYAGHLYVGWVEWQLDKSVMLFSRSADDGVTWSPAIQISVHPGLPRDDNGSLGGYFQAVAEDGSLFVIWNDGNSILLTESRDGGKRFRRPRAVIQTGPPYFGDVPGVSRVEGFPEIASDAHRGKGRGRLYIAWSDYRNGDVDVFVASSADRGRKWSAPVRVNDDVLHNGRDQFYQSLAVDAATGDVYVMFYDRREDARNRAVKMTLARSIDGGKTFSNYALSNTPFDGRGAFLGDYTWVAALRNHVYGAWTETVPAADETQANARPHTVIRFGSADFARSHNAAER